MALPESDATLNKIYLAVLMLLACFASAYLFLMTPWGIGLGPDATQYISAARGILNGHGLVVPAEWDGTLRPFTQYGPFFSITLAGLGLAGLDPVLGARIINGVLFGLNIFIAGRWLLAVTRSFWAALAGAWLVAASFVLLQLHAQAIAEPLFIFLTFLGLFCLKGYLEDGKSNRVFIGAIFLLSLAFLTKYSGISAVAAGVISVLLAAKIPLGRRLKLAFLLGAAGMIPMLVWGARNHSLTGTNTGIGFEFYFNTHMLPTFRELLAYPSIWLLPKAVPAFLRAIVLLAFVCGFGLGWKKLTPRQFSNSLWLALIVCHLGVYLGTNLFLGDEGLDDRALSPVFLAVILLGTVLMHHLWQVCKHAPFKRKIVLTVGLFFIISYSCRAAAWGLGVYQSGLGYASREWRNSEMMKKIGGLPAGVPVFSNGQDAIYILTGRASSAIPSKELYFRGHSPNSAERSHSGYAAELAAMRHVLEDKGGYIVYLRAIDWRSYYPTEEEMQAALPLALVSYAQDGAIYQLRSSVA